MKRSHRLSAAIFLLLAPVPAAFGYIQLMTQTTPPVPLTRPDATQIQFYINSQLVAGFQSNASGKNVTIIAPGSDPVGAARAALATWNASGANVKFLPLKSTNLVHDPTDGNMVITLATSTQDISFVGAAVAVTNAVFVTSSGQDPFNSNLNVVNGSIVDSDILLNPTVTFTTDGSGSASDGALASGNTTQDFQAVMTHELGHSLGANHTGLLGATMFQYAAIGDRYPSVDDITFAKMLYPPSGNATLGTISGTITASGGAPIAYGMLTMIDAAQKLTLGGLTNPDGTYSVQVPPGNYVIYAEPFNAIIQPGNFYMTQAQAAQATTFETTFYGGFASPTAVSVTAGGTSTATFSVTSGSTTLTPPYVGFGTPGKTNDVKTFTQIAGPVPVPSGASVDLVFGGPGFDGTLTTANIAVLGGGVTVTGISKDTATLNLGGSLPLQRLTLKIASTQASTPASIIISKGGTVLSMSAVLVVTPPTPAFISKGVVNAASGQGANGDGAVSPGGLYSIYQGATPLGPAVGVDHAKDYDAYGHIASTLAGVTVTFDGVPAPLFYVSGYIINVQVPFEVAGKTSTNVVVNYYGAASAPVAVPVLPIQPAFFTYTGGSDSIVINADGTFNGDGNGHPLSGAIPAKQNTYVTIYGTGVGATSLGAAGYGSGLQTGVGAPGPPAGYSGNFSCTIGSTKVAAYFGGWTPTAVGLAQWNVQVPTGATGKLSLTCTDNASGATTQAGTIYVN